MYKSLIGGLFLLLVMVHGGLADSYDFYTELPASSSNTIISTISSAYDMRDYDLFEICVQRAIDLNLQGALTPLLVVYNETAPENNGGDSKEKAVRIPYFYATCQALGKLGTDAQATLMKNSMMMDDDDFTAYYIIQALGFMTNSTLALEILHDTASWVSSKVLIAQLVESIKAHQNPNSILYLTTLKLRGNATSMKADINEAIEYLSEFSE